MTESNWHFFNSMFSYQLLYLFLLLIYDYCILQYGIKKSFYLESAFMLKEFSFLAWISTYSSDNFHISMIQSIFHLFVPCSVHLECLSLTVTIKSKSIWVKWESHICLWYGGKRCSKVQEDGSNIAALRWFQDHLIFDVNQIFQDWSSFQEALLSVLDFGGQILLPSPPHRTRH